EWLRGENRFEAKRGIAPNQHQEMRKTNRTLHLVARCWCAPVFVRADCGAATNGQPIRQRYRTISVADLAGSGRSMGLFRRATAPVLQRPCLPRLYLDIAMSALWQARSARTWCIMVHILDV